MYHRLNIARFKEMHQTSTSKGVVCNRLGKHHGSNKTMLRFYFISHSPVTGGHSEWLPQPLTKPTGRTRLCDFEWTWPGNTWHGHRISFKGNSEGTRALISAWFSHNVNISYLYDMPHFCKKKSTIKLLKTSRSARFYQSCRRWCNTF